MQKSNPTQRKRERFNRRIAKPTPEKSDVDHLRDWLSRLDSWAASDLQQPNRHTGGLVLPHRAASRAMMRMSTKHPHIIKQIDHRTDDAKQCLDRWDASDAAGELADAVELLREAIASGISAIEKAESTPLEKSANQLSEFRYPKVLLEAMAAYITEHTENWSKTDWDNLSPFRAGIICSLCRCGLTHLRCKVWVRIKGEVKAHCIFCLYGPFTKETEEKMMGDAVKQFELDNQSGLMPEHCSADFLPSEICLTATALDMQRAPKDVMLRLLDNILSAEPVPTHGYIDLLPHEVVAAKQDAKATEPAATPKKKIDNSLEAVNKRARVMLAVDPDMRDKTCREWAKRLECSEGQVIKSAVWKAIQDEKPKPKSTTPRRTQTLSKGQKDTKLEASALDKLIADQELDMGSKHVEIPPESQRQYGCG